jgi:predicted phosphoribosyltransferase
MTPPNFRSVGQYYLDFGQLDDDDVTELLQQGSMSRRRIVDSAQRPAPDDPHSV